MPAGPPLSPWTRRPLLSGSGRLRSCPFCRSLDLDLYEHRYARLFAILCRECGAEGPSREDPAEAIRRWNRRAER